MSKRRIVVAGQPKAPPPAEPAPAPPSEPVPERPKIEVAADVAADWSAPPIAVLVEQIRNDRFADPPREVLADVLERAGESARAELIQLQVRRANLPSWDPQVIELELRERALLGAHEERWRGELPVLPGVTWGPFARGFVSAVMFETFDALVEHGEECFAAAPIERVAIPWPRSRKRVELDAVTGLRELTIFGTAMARNDLEWLAESPLLATVRSLTFLDSAMENIAPLVKSPHVGRLETLSLPLTPLLDDSLYRLTQATLPDLTTLELSKAEPQEEYYGSGRRRRAPRAQGSNYAAVALAGWRGLAQLRRLDLSGTKLGSSGLTTLLESPHISKLQALAVRDIVVRRADDPLTAFGGMRTGAIDELDVSDNDLDEHGAACMATCRALRELKVLGLERVTSKHFDRLAQATWFDSLRVLACGQSALLPIVKRAPAQLHTLRVTADRSTTTGLVKQLSSAALPAVTRLDLSEARLDDNELRLLGAIETLPNVVSLQLARAGERPRFTRPAIAAFLQSPLAARLASIDTGFHDLDRLPTRSRSTIGEGPYRGPRRYL